MKTQDADSTNRRYHRVPFDGQARLYSSTAMWDTEVVDLSLRGALVKKPDSWTGKAGMNLRLELRLPGMVVISMGVVAANVTETHIGLKAERLDFDSFSHLKRMIELNVGDADAISREIASLGSV
jgi:PilZ domain